jgi:hypothetical protein
MSVTDFDIIISKIKSYQMMKSVMLTICGTVFAQQENPF